MTMRLMKKCALLLLALLAFSVAAGAQETADDPYEFILAKLAADDGRFDEALLRIDKIVAKNPQNAVILYERALILIDASKVDTAEAELRKVVALQPNFYDAERVLGRVLLDRAGTDRTKVDEALVHLQNAFRIYPDDLGTGMAISQIYLVRGRPAEAEKVLYSMLERAPDDPDVLASLGLAQVGRKKYDEAAKTFRTLLALPDAGEGVQTLAKTQLAFIDLQKGNYQQAVDAAKPLFVFHDKVNPQAISIALDAMKRQKRYSDAVALMQPLVDKYASDTFVNARYIEMLARAGDKDRARVAASTQSKFGVRNTISAAEAYMQADQYDQAIGVVRD